MCITQNLMFTFIHLDIFRAAPLQQTQIWFELIFNVITFSKHVQWTIDKHISV